MAHDQWCCCAECVPDPVERAAKAMAQDLPDWDAVFEGEMTRDGSVIKARLVGGKRVTIRVENEPGE